LVLPDVTFHWVEIHPVLKEALTGEFELVQTDEGSSIYSLIRSRSEAREAEAQAKRAGYEALVGRLRNGLAQILPADAVVAVISKGDPELLNLQGRRVWHFPQTPSGEYAGRHPRDSAAAIAHLEELRAKGLEYLVIPAPYYWWLEFYAELAQHLQTHYKLVEQNEDWRLYDLRPPRGAAIAKLKRMLRSWIGSNRALL
jgi:hypothetical protein